MNNNYKLTKVEAICLILIVMVNKLILNIPYYIVDSVGTGALINLIYIGIIGFLFTLLINMLFKNFKSCDILDVSEYLGGKPLQICIGLISILSFFFVAFLTLTNFSNMIKTIYYNNSPLIFLCLFFIIGILIANLAGFKSIVRTICLVVPFAIVSILIALLAIYDNFSFDKFTPIFGYSYKTTFLNGLLNIFSFYIITYYYFLLPLLKDNTDFKKVTKFSFIISWGLLFLTVLSILAIFPVSINMEPLNSLYMLSRQIELGDFIQRIDAIFILLWLISVFSYLSFCIFIIDRVIKKLTRISDEKMLAYSTTSILLGISLFPINMPLMRLLENTVYKYLIIILDFGVGITVLILANIKYSHNRKKGK